VGITEHRNTIRIEFDNLVDRIREAFRCLVRESVYKIDANRSEIQSPAQVKDGLCTFIGLNTANGFLNQGIEILDSHRYSIETQPTKRFQMVFSRYSGVDFHTYLGVGGKPESFVSEKEKFLQLCGGKIGWSSTAPVKLYDRPGFVQIGGKGVYFPLEFLKIRSGSRMVLLSDGVASAEQAETVAEWQVHV